MVSRTQIPFVSSEVETSALAAGPSTSLGTSGVGVRT